MTLLLFYPTNRDHERVDAVPLVVVAAPVGPDQVEGLKVQAEKADVFFLKKVTQNVKTKLPHRVAKHCCTVAALLDGERHGRGVGQRGGESRVLDVGAVLGDRVPIGAAAEDEHAADPKAGRRREGVFIIITFDSFDSDSSRNCNTFDTIWEQCSLTRRLADRCEISNFTPRRSFLPRSLPCRSTRWK